MKRVWTWIKGTENKYKISNYGEVISYKQQEKGKMLKKTKTPQGYYYITINGKKRTIHRLVAESFIENINKYPCINHIDGNKENNYVGNLEWCTYSHNTREAFKLGLQTTWCGTKFGKDHPNYKYRGKWKTQKNVFQYDKKCNLINKYSSATEAERLTNLSATHISECCRNIRKSCGGYIWKYQ